MSYVAPTPPDDFYRDKSQRHRHSRQPAAIPPKMVKCPLPRYDAPPPVVPPPPPAAAQAYTAASSGQEATRMWPVPGNVLDCMATCAYEPSIDRKKRIADENNMQFGMLEPVWTGNFADVNRHLFTPEGSPRFTLTLDVWKPLIRTYFHWFMIPRIMCTRVWEEIVNNLLKLPPDAMDVAFQAWAFGCLCKFHLEDKMRKEHAEYDPQHPMLTM